MTNENTQNEIEEKSVIPEGSNQKKSGQESAELPFDMSRFDFEADDEEKLSSEDISSRAADKNEEAPEIESEESEKETGNPEASMDSNQDEASTGDSVSIEQHGAAIHDEGRSWSRKAHEVVKSWSEKSQRHSRRDAFKNGFVLPLLASMGYDVFDPDEVDPVADGNGYIINDKNGQYAVIVGNGENEGFPYNGDEIRVQTIITIGNQRTTVSHGSKIIVDVATSKIPNIYLFDLFVKNNFSEETFELLGKENEGTDEILLNAIVNVIMADESDFAEKVRTHIWNNGLDEVYLIKERIQILLSRFLEGN